MGNILVARERWADGHYHAVSREHGRFVRNARWRDSSSLDKVAAKSWEFHDYESTYSICMRGKNAHGEWRSYSVSTDRRVYIKRGGKLRLDTHGLKREIERKYRHSPGADFARIKYLGTWAFGVRQK